MCNSVIYSFSSVEIQFCVGGGAVKGITVSQDTLSSHTSLIYISNSYTTSVVSSSSQCRVAVLPTLSNACLLLKYCLLPLITLPHCSFVIVTKLWIKQKRYRSSILSRTKDVFFHTALKSALLYSLFLIQ